MALGDENLHDDVEEMLNTQGIYFTAPLISGGLALMIQAFRGQLGNTELACQAICGLSVPNG